jgi:hypothetical protein
MYICLFAVPPYILMYFTELEGNVKSFNYNAQLGNGKWGVQILYRALLVLVRVIENGAVPFRA